MKPLGKFLARQISRVVHLEFRNVGYSLKEPSQLGMPGSRLRNPTIAAVLHDLHLAEAKGTGIRAMRRLAAEAGLPCRNSIPTAKPMNSN